MAGRPRERYRVAVNKTAVALKATLVRMRCIMLKSQASTRRRIRQRVTAVSRAEAFAIGLGCDVHRPTR